MENEAVTKTINLVLAPVVMITACAIMLNGLIVRYASLGDRVRNVHREILDLQELDLSQNRTKSGRLGVLNRLLPDLLNHHHQVHDVLVLVYLATLVFLADMLIIALAVSTQQNILSQLVIIVFLGGLALLGWGMALISYELRTSHNTVQLEVQENCQLCKKHRS